MTVHDLNAARRCQRCGRRLVKHESDAPVSSWTWNADDQLSTRTVIPNGYVIWACPVCDFGDAS